MLMMILNFIACLANAMICFIFFSYRINSIDEYSDLEYFKGSDFKEKNDLNTTIYSEKMEYVLVVVVNL